MSTQDCLFEKFTRTVSLRAYVVDDRGETRVNGYALHEDLAANYSFSDLIFLAHVGELPGDDESTAFEAALFTLAGASVQDPPGHAGRIAHVIGGGTKGTGSVVAIGLFEEAHALVNAHAPFLDWCESRSTGEAPPGFSCRAASDRKATSSLASRLPLHLRPYLDEGVTPTAAALWVLHRLGFRRESMEMVIVQARMPCSMAEAVAAQRGDLRGYPMNNPRYVYEHRETE